MKKAGIKYPDCLAYSCKRSSVNWMTADSRLSWCIMDFFSCLQLFKHIVLNSTSLAGCRTWCPTDLHQVLQTFSTCAVKQIKGVEECSNKLSVHLGGMQCNNQMSHCKVYRQLITMFQMSADILNCTTLCLLHKKNSFDLR